MMYRLMQQVGHDVQTYATGRACIRAYTIGGACIRAYTIVGHVLRLIQ